MLTMKQVCSRVGMRYETLKFYCNEGLVPGVRRDKHNHRVFDERDVAWLQSLGCLKRCGMSLEEMKTYMTLCLEGESSIPRRREMLAAQREQLLIRQAEVQASLAIIDRKQQFYADVLEGKKPYVSNLIEPHKDGLH